MGLFDIFKKNNKGLKPTMDNGVPGPTYLEGKTRVIEAPTDLQPHEWRRQLQSPEGQLKFRIRYYGALHERYTNLITGTDVAPALVYAEDVLSGEQILLFDGCSHGYNALLCDTWTEDQRKGRKAKNIYQDPEGNEIFEIIISTYNGIDYEDEFSEEVDQQGLIELVNGTKMPFETLKRNGFDTLQIRGINNGGRLVEILSEELS